MIIEESQEEEMIVEESKEEMSFDNRNRSG
jgi:hypothetical protein